MGKIFKAGRVVLMTSGRYAGKKAIVARTYEDGSKKYRFPHLLVVGIARNPRNIKRRINKKKFLKKTGVKPFIKCINQSHVIPTRCVVSDLDLKGFKEDILKNPEAKKQLKGDWRKILTQKYRNLPDPSATDKASHIRFFFKRLRF